MATDTTDTGMKATLPKVVREGDVLSATWLNQTRDYIKELGEKATSASSSMGADLPSTSLTCDSIGKDTKYRPYEEDDEFSQETHHDFELRLTMKSVMGSSEGTPYIEVHNGRVCDYRGNITDLRSKGGSGGSSSGGSSSGQSDSCWQSICVADGTVSVYLIIRQSSVGEVESLEIAQEPEKEVMWEPVDTLGQDDPSGGSGGSSGGDSGSSGGGGGDDGAGTKGVLCILLGTVTAEEMEDAETFYTIEQHHLGMIELQTVNVAKLQVTGGSGSPSGTLSDDSGDIGGSGDDDGEDDEPAPIGLFRERKANAFFFKALQQGEGLTLADGDCVSFALNRANYEPADSGSDSGGGGGGSDTQESGGSGSAAEPSSQDLGGVDSIDYDAEVTAPCIKWGAVKLSLANSPEPSGSGSKSGSSTGSGGDTSSQITGGVSSIAYDSEASAPFIERGAIKLVLANCSASGDQGTGGGSGGAASGNVTGAISGISHSSDASAPSIEHGAIKLTIADSVKSCLGAIKDVVVEYVSPSAIGDPEQKQNYIEAGVMHLSVPITYPDEGSGSGSGSGGSTPGGGGSSGSSGSSTPSPTCNCPTYEFDDTYFEVTDSGDTRKVSLKSSVISELVQECVNEISVDVNVTGLSETTEYGSIKVTTAGSGSASDLTTSTTVTY